MPSFQTSSSISIKASQIGFKTVFHMFSRVSFIPFQASITLFLNSSFVCHRFTTAATIKPIKAATARIGSEIPAIAVPIFVIAAFTTVTIVPQFAPIR